MKQHLPNSQTTNQNPDTHHLTQTPNQTPIQTENPNQPQNPTNTPRPHTSRNSVKDPVAFAEHWLGEKPWSKQRKILRAIRDHRQVAVRSCNASGKTYAAALAAIWWLMAHEEALVITTAPSERQVKNTLWKEIRAIWERNKDLIGGKLNQTQLELSNKRVAYGFSTNTPERFQGFHSENTLIIVDEAAGVREFVFEAILGLMTSRNAKILLIGNPAGLAGTFYDAFHKNRKHWKTIHIAAANTPNFQNQQPPINRHPRAGGDPTAQTTTSPFRSAKGARSEQSEMSGVCTSPVIPAQAGSQRGEGDDTSPLRFSVRGRERSERGMPGEVRGIAPRHPLATVIPAQAGIQRGSEGAPDPEYIPGLATPEWAQHVLETKGEDSYSYQIRVLGEFPDEANDTLIPLKHIENAVEKLFQDIDQQQPVMGLDVARFGDDQTVAIVRRGNSVLDLVAHRKSDLMNTTGRTLEIARKHNAQTINIDEVGLGSAVVDRIQELKNSKEINGITPVGVNGATKSQLTEKFANLRTQMFDGLRQRFADGEISIPNDPELISQLASITYIYNSRGQLQIETKQQIRDSGRQSPDKADALALAFTTPTQNQHQIWVLAPNKNRRRRI